MSDWTAGYVADIGYTFGYYAELNPLQIRMAFANAGLAFPDVGTACELGFGQGMSANMHAAASVTQWHGTDFNPAQAGFAQELAQVSGANARLHDDAFADFATREDLPDFDYIGLHGIWSWISDENRAVIVDFVRRKLKVGGVLYISYNTLPGWSTFAPIRHLMTQHAAILGSDGQGIVGRVDGAIAFTDRLLASNPAYLRANASVSERMNKIKEQNRHYLAHEYFNRDWQPMYFADMEAWLSPAKLNFACSAHYLDHIDAINLNAEQLSLLATIPDQMFRETIRDYMVNQQFRRDYWVKGARKLTALEQGARLRGLKVVLTAHRPDISYKFNGALGEASMAENIYGPILDFLADHKIRSLGQIEAAMKDNAMTFSQVQQAVMVLIGGGRLANAQDEPVTRKARPATDKLNEHLLQRARGSAEISYLVSPVTGGGIIVSQFPQLFLLAIKEGQKQPADWARSAWGVLAAQGQKIIKGGVTLETPEDNLAEMTVQATNFAEKSLPILKALQVV